ncbi:DUF4097 family beta strand repeat-containing protein [Paenibacillus sp. OV219]|uniref:DUF4097 family beta strand repeat-containing protein n=1 Tax=Paenibacillus sp. OV219 TaxID=1884377 RepID=UPI0008CD4DBC|nr:DUF4097 family beta strand repeat-containing protein [Paenibacillus sp. OV219]SEM72443.1 hypothetical protein SAMN05518847_101621 [Paenibacillus sp. OV219]
MFRKKKKLLLASIAVLIVLMIADIWTKQFYQIFEQFGEQFVNEQKTYNYSKAHPDATADSKHELTVDRKSIEHVLLTGVEGDISVKRTPESVIRLQYTVTAKANDQNEANRKRDAVQVEKKVENGQLTFVTLVDGKPIGSDSITTDYVLLIPDQLKLSVESEEGSILIDGIHGDVNVKSTHGLMDVSNTVGTVSVDTASENVYIDGITGDVHLVSHSSEVNLNRVAGNVTTDVHQGSIFLTQIKGDVTGVFESSPSYMREIAGSVKVEGQYSDIQMDQIRGAAQIVSHGGTTRLVLSKDVGYTLRASVDGGAIQSNLPAKQEASDDNKVQLNRTIGNGTWPVDVDAESCTIIIHSN